MRIGAKKENAEGGILADYVKPAVPTIIALLAVSMVVWAFGLAPRLATIDSAIGNMAMLAERDQKDLKTRIAESEGRLAKAIEQGELRLTKSIDEAKGFVRNVERDVSQLRTDISGLKADVDNLTMRTASTNTTIEAIQNVIVAWRQQQFQTIARSWVITVDPAQTANPSDLNVYIVDAKTGDMRIVGPIRFNPKSAESQRNVIGRVWGMVKAADLLAQPLMLPLAGETVVPDSIANKLWLACSFSMTTDSSQMTPTRIR